jgi:multiple antibiotic resistance protein
MQIYLLAFTALFSVINPLGTVPIFIGLTKDKDKKEIQMIAMWTAIDVLAILLISFFFGQHVLGFFGISLSALKITGGMIMASSGFALLTGNFSKHKGMKKREKDDAFQRENISLTPLALPMLAGPGTISLLITFQFEYSDWTDKYMILGAILSVCLATLIILSSGRFINKLLGASGMNGLSRIIGFIVIAIGVEYIISTVGIWD